MKDSKLLQFQNFSFNRISYWYHTTWSILLLGEYNLNSNVRKNILLFWVPSIVVTTPYTAQWPPRGIFPIIFVLTSLEMSQKWPAHIYLPLKSWNGLYTRDYYLISRYFKTITRCRFHNKPYAIWELYRQILAHISLLFK